MCKGKKRKAKNVETRANIGSARNQCRNGPVTCLETPGTPPECWRLILGSWGRQWSPVTHVAPAHHPQTCRGRPRCPCAPLQGPPQTLPEQWRPVEHASMPRSPASCPALPPAHAHAHEIRRTNGQARAGGRYHRTPNGPFSDKLAVPLLGGAESPGDCQRPQPCWPSAAAGTAAPAAQSWSVRGGSSGPAHGLRWLGPL